MRGVFVVSVKENGENLVRQLVWCAAFVSFNFFAFAIFRSIVRFYRNYLFTFFSLCHDVHLPFSHNPAHI